MFYIVIYVILIVVLILFISAQYIIPDKKVSEKYYNYDWSSKWTELDFKARMNADCKPIATIHRNMGRLSPLIWIVPDSCEQGLPHTRSVDVIAIPKSYPKERLASTLEHELIHLYQRIMPDSWSKFYKLKWHYEIYNEPPVGMPVELTKMIRANPDTASAPWCCWMNIYWPVPVYISKSNLSLSKAPIKWWNQSNNTISDTAPEEWKHFFGYEINQNEHPHEISAEFLSGPIKNRDENFNSLSESNVALRLLNEAWDEDKMYPVVNRDE
jgi:hypothetical protein